MKKYFSRQQNETDLHLVKTLHYNAEETKEHFLYDASRTKSIFICRQQQQTVDKWLKAAKDSLIRRARARANFERANRELERAKQTGKNISQATQNSQVSYIFNLRWVFPLIFRVPQIFWKG